MSSEFSKFVDKAGRCHARFRDSKWAICGLYKKSTDVPLLEDSKVTCKRCRWKLYRRRKGTPTGQEITTEGGSDEC